MPQVHKSALVPYSAEQMYALVLDIGAYPEFVPWVNSVAIHSRDDRQIRAGIELAKGPIRKSFTTLNTLTPETGMHLSLLEGPFRHLAGDWGFKSLGKAGSRVTLDMDFEFSSRMLSMTIGPIFNEMVNRLVDAFIKRAPVIYGKR